MALLAKSTNKNTNKKQSDPAGAHAHVNTSYTQRTPVKSWHAFFAPITFYYRILFLPMFSANRALGFRYILCSLNKGNDHARHQH